MGRACRDKLCRPRPAPPALKVLGRDAAKEMNFPPSLTDSDLHSFRGRPGVLLKPSGAASPKPGADVPLCAVLSARAPVSAVLREAGCTRGTAVSWMRPLWEGRTQAAAGRWRRTRRPHARRPHARWPHARRSHARRPFAEFCEVRVGAVAPVRRLSSWMWQRQPALHPPPTTGEPRPEPLTHTRRGLRRPRGAAGVGAGVRSPLCALSDPPPAWRDCPSPTAFQATVCFLFGKRFSQGK